MSQIPAKILLSAIPSESETSGVRNGLKDSDIATSILVEGDKPPRGRKNVRTGFNRDDYNSRYAPGSFQLANNKIVKPECAQSLEDDSDNQYQGVKFDRRPARTDSPYRRPANPLRRPDTPHPHRQKPFYTPLQQRLSKPETKAVGIAMDRKYIWYGRRHEDYKHTLHMEWLDRQERT